MGLNMMIQTYAMGMDYVHFQIHARAMGNITEMRVKNGHVMGYATLQSMCVGRLEHVVRLIIVRAPKDGLETNARTVLTVLATGAMLPKPSPIPDQHRLLAIAVLGERCKILLHFQHVRHHTMTIRRLYVGPT